MRSRRCSPRSSGRRSRPRRAPLRAAAATDDRVIEEVAQRVLAKLSDQVRPGILDVAERLVRDEIERIKQNR